MMMLVSDEVDHLPLHQLRGGSVHHHGSRFFVSGLVRRHYDHGLAAFGLPTIPLRHYHVGNDSTPLFGHPQQVDGQSTRYPSPYSADLII